MSKYRRFSQRVTLTLRNSIGKAYSNRAVKSAFTKMKTTILDLVRNRTEKGYDIDSKRFPKHSRKYNKKAAYRYQGIRRGIVPKYASSSKSDFLRLTGNLFNELDAKLEIGKKDINYLRFFIDIFVKDESTRTKGQVQGLITGNFGGNETGKERKFLGLARNGKFKGIEEAIIEVEFQKYLRIDTLQFKSTTKGGF